MPPTAGRDFSLSCARSRPQIGLKNQADRNTLDAVGYRAIERIIHRLCDAATAGGVAMPLSAIFFMCC